MRKLSDFAAEIEAHIQLEADRLRAEGLSASDALAAARRRFGNVTTLRERFYERTRHAWIEHAWQDVRYAARLLSRNPTFALAAVLTLALGIGANTAIFTAVDALVLRPLPFRDPSQLMSIETRVSQHPEVDAWTSQPDFVDLRDHNRSFEGIAAVSPVWNVVMTGRGDAERLEPLFVSGNFFSLLGVKPALGRLLTPADDRTGAPGAVILSHGFWQRRFGGDRAVLGQSLNLDGGSFTIAGVLPADFHYAGEPVAGSASEIELWLPLAANQLNGSQRFLRFLKIVGRLNAGVAPAQGADEVRRLGAGLQAQYPDVEKGMEYGARPLVESVAGKIRPQAYLLLGAVGLVLAMACVSVSNLLLVRAGARRREMFMRAALGASRSRLLLQMLTEGLLLAAAGGAAGFALAYAGLRLLTAAAPITLLSGRTIALDSRALWFTSALTLASAILASLPPALKMIRPRLAAGLRESAQSVAGGPLRLRSALVGVQIAFALMLVVGAGLLLRSFLHLLQVRPGFDTEHVATVTTQTPLSARSPEQRTALYRVIEQRMLALPGVRSVDAVSRLPLSGQNIGTILTIEGRPSASGQDDGAEYRVATPHYFSTMGIPLLAGRFFEDRDNVPSQPRCIVNESLARVYWPGQDAVGKRMKLGPNPDRQPWTTVVGVVGDVRHFGLEAAARPEVYRPYAVNPLSNPILVIRVADGRDPATLLPSLAAVVRASNPDIPAYNVMVLRDLARRSASQRRFVMTLLLLFAAAAALLAAVGIYGAASQLVAMRTREIGLRMALGATPAAALRLVLAGGARFTLAGVAGGLLGAALLSRAMRGVVFGIDALDLASFTAGAVLMGVVAMASCLVPAVRATRLDPMTALREE